MKLSYTFITAALFAASVHAAPVPRQVLNTDDFNNLQPGGFGETVESSSVPAPVPTALNKRLDDFTFNSGKDKRGRFGFLDFLNKGVVNDQPSVGAPADPVELPTEPPVTILADPVAPAASQPAVVRRGAARRRRTFPSLVGNGPINPNTGIPVSGTNPTAEFSNPGPINPNTGQPAGVSKRAIPINPLTGQLVGGGTPTLDTPSTGPINANTGQPAGMSKRDFTLTAFLNGGLATNGDRQQNGPVIPDDAAPEPVADPTIQDRDVKTLLNTDAFTNGATAPPLPPAVNAVPNGVAPPVPPNYLILPPPPAV